MKQSKKNNKMLITGVSGLLGNNLAYYFKDQYTILGIFCNHPVSISGIQTQKCDLSFINPLKKVIQNFNPSIIIHCASLANVDQCEKFPEITHKINVLATKNIVDIIAEKEIKLVYISTDSVYNGVKGNFLESDKINPLNYYGLSKYEGELEVQRKDNFIILRTNLFGWNIQEKKSLGEWILEELKANRRIKCFRDVLFSSIYTFDLARVIDISLKNNITGIYNCGGSDSCSKYEFALKIADLFGFDRTLVIPISIDDFPFKAKRGKNLTLNVSKIQKLLDYKLPTMDHSISEFYKDYRCGLPNRIKQNQLENQKASVLIPYGRHWIDENDIQAVTETLRSDRITQGPKIKEFEEKLAKYCGVQYSVAVNSGTSALHIACLVADVRNGDEVITSPITFVASANCAVYCNAKPIFADIDLKTYNIDPEEIKKKITIKTKAVIPVHLAGQSCDMEVIYKIIKEMEMEFNTKICIIEDACHALGSYYNQKKVGSCTFSDMTVMSFHPVKHITTGEGGAVFTNNEFLYKKLKLLRSHGITSNPKEFISGDRKNLYDYSNSQSLLNPWYYEQIILGYNYRITDIQTTLGISQLKKIDNVRKRRRKIINMYNQAFCKMNYIQIPFESDKCDSNFHLYILLFDFNHLGITRTQLMFKLKKLGIQTQVHYIPVHTQPFYQRNFGTSWGDCPRAEAYYQKCLSIPLYPAMTDNDVKKVINKIEDICSNPHK
jgi:UDP-4-amino-4,6-dideoxy-N-acetyl-beta-L-altrosamine transaminase/dTDP-4-dehydrorhamnose reductase